MGEHNQLAEIGVVELLESDPRPSFVFDLDWCGLPPNKLQPQQQACIAYRNGALVDNASLAFALSGPPSGTRDEFWEWVQAPNPGASSSLPFRGVYWTRHVLRKRWAVVSGNAQPAHSARSPSQETKKPTPNNFTQGARIPYSPTQGRASLVKQSDAHFRRINSEPAAGPNHISSARAKAQSKAFHGGWTVPMFVTNQEEPFLDIINNVDWASTPLGGMSAWPPRLHQTFSQILVDSRPIAISWGPDHTTIYNEAFSRLCGCRHPQVLGKPTHEIWPDKREWLRNSMRESALKQRAVADDEDLGCFIENADGTLRETYLKWSIIPITENNQAVGLMHSVTETTSMRLWERRMKMLINLGEVLVTARDVKAYWRKTLEDLEAVEPRFDIPLAILYSVDEGTDAELGPVPNRYASTKMCHLEGSLGVPHGHPLSPPLLNLGMSDEGLSAAFRRAMGEFAPISIRTADDSFPLHLQDGLNWRGFGDPCQEALVVPIRPTKEEDVMGLLVLGLNPRRPYDNGYRQYISLLNQKLTTSLASTVLLQEEERRGWNAAEQAAYDKAMLKEKLDARTKEATEFIRRFEAVAQFTPVGMCFGNAQGNVTFANDAWFRITGVESKESPGPESSGGYVTMDDFLARVVDEDRMNIVRAYEDVRGGKNATFEFRVRKREGDTSLDETTAPSSSSPSFEKTGLNLVRLEGVPADERHVLASAKAERSPDGAVIRILTCLTDVTAQRKVADEAVRRAQEAENLKRMAEFATVGMYDMDLEGRLIGANRVFYEMCGVGRAAVMDGVSDGAPVVRPLHECVVAEDFPLLERTLSLLLSEGKQQTAELRFKKPWTAEDKAMRIVAPRWVSATFLPVRSSDGLVRSFTGCLSDISMQKWQLERERQRKEDAIESKRQQESFIDITSHEMRNPLSAIIHCADAVIASLAKVQQLERVLTPPPTSTMGSVSPRDKGTEHPVTDAAELINNGIENAETIILCAQHQKRIVDDILTMSKLDSRLLVVTPITANPVQIVQEALKMFEVEARRVDINLSMVVDKSYQRLNIDFLQFDPSRVKQVLINLLTNALKFTGSGPTSNVTVGISASKSPPNEATSSVQFIPRKVEKLPGTEAATEAQPEAQETNSIVGRGEPIYIMFEVKDTGEGLNDEEKKILFQRFVQASSRTHVKYGGSGLGLFISRRLTEMQDGAIGVASQPGVGSTFAFYIKTFRPDAAALGEARRAARESAAFQLEPLSLDTNAAGHPSDGSSLGGATARKGAGLSPLSPVVEDPKITGILVVEDNLINQQITRRGLLDRGYRVEVANHGLEALEILRLSDRYALQSQDDGVANNVSTLSSSSSKKFELSVILMDMEMPTMDGLTCTREIRGLEARGKIVGGRIPIIAVSANARMEQVLEAKAAGCDDVLVKPYRMPELITKMKMVVGALANARRQQEQLQQQQQQLLLQSNVLPRTALAPTSLPTG
ncbi:hypothetical protein RB594_005145 [Gaeumannomyces avenae]